jgi:hypothetical protein
MWSRFQRSPRSIHRLIVTLRVAAVLICLALVALAARLMLALSWQIDFVLAIAACLAWAYVFERGEK